MVQTLVEQGLVNHKSDVLMLGLADRVALDGRRKVGGKLIEFHCIVVCMQT